MDTRYCIQCGKEVPVTETPTGLIHTYTVHHTMVCGCPEYDVIVCDGAFTTSPPPELWEGWQDGLLEPYPIEQCIMNLHAIQLELEIEGIR